MNLNAQRFRVKNYRNIDDSPLCQATCRLY